MDSPYGRLEKSFRSAGNGYLRRCEVLFPLDYALICAGVLNQVSQLHQSGAFAAAEALLVEALATQPDDDALLHGLGVTRLVLGKPQAAAQAIQAAIVQAPQVAIYSYNLGLALEAIGDVFAAGDAYRQAIQLDPQQINAYLNLGNIYYQLGDFSSAEQIYRAALELEPENFGGNWNLGNVLMAQQRLDAALDAYGRANQHNPGNADFEENYQLAQDLAAQPAYAAAKYFADVLHSKGDNAAAIEQYQKALDHGGPKLAIQPSLVNCYKQLYDYDRAIPLCHELLQTDPDDRLHYFLAFSIFQQAGLVQSALQVQTQAEQHFPGDLGLQLEGCGLFPLIYQDEAELSEYRQRFEQQLSALIEPFDFTDRAAVQVIFKQLQHTTNFLLAYQGQNDLALQKYYSQFVAQILAVEHGQWQQPLPFPEVPSGKIRVGFLSNVMGTNTLGRFFLGWVQQLDPDLFEIYIYHINRDITPLTREFRMKCQEFRHIADWSIAEIAPQVIADQLHILVLPEIGMKPEMTLLSNLRLAPIQCTTWTHPVTSGATQIDYFLSSALMEPDDGQAHYSETLVGLPGIGIHYAKPEVPALTATRSEFGLSDDRVVYLCCQSLFKYLPQDDWVWPAIAQQCPQAQFIFIQHQSSRATELFQQRLQRSFSNYGLNYTDFCVFTPRLPEERYMQLNLLSDVFLDSHRWSGGITTMKAIACGLPIVTCPSDLMRGRHSYGILRTMDIEETIGLNLENYVQIAARLGNEPAWRQAIVETMQHQQSQLFSDMRCVEALQDFFQAAIFEKMMG